MKSFDTVVIIVTTSSSITLSFTGLGLIILPKSIVTACGSSTGNIVIHEIVMQEHKKYKKLYERDQLTVKPLINFIKKF